MDVKRSLFILLLAGLATSDLLCKTTGNLGCRWSCSMKGRGTGNCENKNEGVSCQCDEDNNKVDEDESESFWADVNTDEEFGEDTLSQNNELEDEVSSEFILEKQVDQETEADTEGSGEDLTEDEDEDYLPWLLRKVIFFPAQRKGFFGFLREISKPSTYGLETAINFRIPSVNGSLGAWFMYPEGSQVKSVSELSGDDKLVLYFHGSSATRGYSHRVSLYSLLLKMGYHVLAFDYRGYADSTPIKLSEETVVEDAISVLSWLNSTIREEDRPLVLLWGHSLGTAIATHSLSKWQNREKGIEMSGLILESPFSTMADEIHRFALGRFVAKMLGKNHSEILKEAKAEFLSTVYLPQIEAPTLILHADNDRLVPSYLGERLYKAALNGGKENVKFVLFPSDLRLGHKYIYSAPGLSTFIEDLESEAETFRNRFTITDNQESNE